MLNVRTVFLVGLVGLTASAFAAIPDQATTREDRMASALKDYEGGKKTAATPSPTESVKSHHRAGHHSLTKHAVKHKK